MHRSYEDITSKLGEPFWWDENAVPRYCVFSPNECGVYDKCVILMKIECQQCAKKFKVAYTVNDNVCFCSNCKQYNFIPASETIKEIKDNIQALHWGDPPNHECAGTTMNCNDLEILEFWEKDENLNWIKNPELEVKLDNLFGAENQLLTMAIKKKNKKTEFLLIGVWCARCGCDIKDKVDLYKCKNCHSCFCGNCIQYHAGCM